jgi:hypothetical protein
MHGLVIATTLFLWVRLTLDAMTALLHNLDCVPPPKQAPADAVLLLLLELCTRQGCLRVAWAVTTDVHARLDGFVAIVLDLATTLSSRLGLAPCHCLPQECCGVAWRLPLEQVSFIAILPALF